LKNQLIEKEDSCHKLRGEVVDLRRKTEKGCSTILDEILNSQRLANDKFGLGYYKTVEKVKDGKWTPKEEMGSSSSTEASEVVDLENGQCPVKKGSHQRTSQEEHQRTSSPFPRKSKRDISSRWNQRDRYEYSFNGYCFSCNEFGHKTLDYRHQARKNLENSNNTLRCWRCNHHGHIAK